MGKSKIVNTPVGKINVKPGATPSSEATSTFKEIKKEFEKVAKSGSVSVERLKDGTIGYSCN